MTNHMENDWTEEFNKLCERTIELSVEDRIRYGFTYTYKPVLDDVESRSFDSMEEYRLWCQETLPKHLGYGTSDDLDPETLEALTAANARREIERRKLLPGYQDL